jgi:hypothetical protein
MSDTALTIVPNLPLTGALQIPCTVCHGAGVIQRPIINQQS